MAILPLEMKLKMICYLAEVLLFRSKPKLSRILGSFSMKIIIGDYAKLDKMYSNLILIQQVMFDSAQEKDSS